MKSGMHPSSTVTVLPQGATSALLCLLRYKLATQNISNLICGGELGSAAVANSFEDQRGSKPRTSSPLPDASRPKLSGVHEIRRYGRKRQLNAEGPLNATCANRQANGGARDYAPQVDASHRFRSAICFFRSSVMRVFLRKHLA